MVRNMISPEKDGWQRNDNNKSWLLSFAAAMVIVILIFRFTRATPPMLLITLVILTIIIFQIVGYKPRTLSKMFSSSLNTTRETISQVLDEKGLPYDVDNGRYYLIGSSLRIETKLYQHKGLEGTLVQFVPYEGVHMPIIMSLSGRFDEALAQHNS